MHFLAEYSVFLAKTVTIVAAVILILVTFFGLLLKGKTNHREGKINLTNLNQHFTEMVDNLQTKLLSKPELKHLHQAEKKAKKKKTIPAKQKRIFIINFNGDIKAQAVSALREEVTAVLAIAHEKDEVVVKVESPGGLVYGYGLAASQLQRLKEKSLHLTICVDKVAASGGYMMACIADHIIAAPFAIVGSIGVVAQVPNFNRILEKNGIDFEQISAGEYKRTLTMFGENTDEKREKFQEQVNETHVLFKQFVAENRTQVEIDQVATGEYWYGLQALKLNLIDSIGTSDDYLFNQHKTAKLYAVEYKTKQSLVQKLSQASAHLASSWQSWRHQSEQEANLL